MVRKFLSDWKNLEISEYKNSAKFIQKSSDDVIVNSDVTMDVI